VRTEGSSIPRAALVSLLAKAHEALEQGDDARAAALLDELHWFGHADAELHQAVHRLQLARARRRGDFAGMLGQLVPYLSARATSFLEAKAPSFEVAVTIAAPPDAVYRAIADVAAYGEWNPWVVLAAGSPATTTLPRAGDELAVVAKLGRRRLRIAHRVLVAVPDERFAWCDLGWFTLFASGRRLRWIEPRSEGTRLVHRIQLFGPMAALAWRLHGAAITAGMTQETEALAARAVRLAATARERASTAAAARPLSV
jgi:hypothetical protein